MFDAIPFELRERRQWLVWRYQQRDGASKPTKVPYQSSGAASPYYPASVVEPSHWATFEEATQTYFASLQSQAPFDGIGFVFTDDDDFAGIDLDQTDDATMLERQMRVANHFQSYAERSPSGTGLHIIVKGRVEYALKHKAVEIYSTGRYFTMTGNVWNNVPIVDYHADLQQLWSELRDWSRRAPLTQVRNGDLFERADDAEIWSRAANAANGERFQRLWNGDWAALIDERLGIPYPSGSEADLALVNLLQFHSGHRVQIDRMFRASPQGQAMYARKGGASRERHIGYLIDRMISQSFDRDPPDVDVEGLRNVVNEFAASVERDRAAALAASSVASSAAILAPTVAAIAEPVPVATNDQSFDPVLLDTAGVTQASPYVGPPGGGMLDSIAGFIYNSAPVPIPEIALAGAIGLFAGIVAATHTVSGLGVNCYVMMIASTGQGKDHARSGAKRLLDAVRDQCNMSVAPEFIGPSHIASGPGLLRIIEKNKSFCCMLDEFGLRLQQMSDPRAAPAVLQTRQMLLELYSGVTAGFSGSAYSDKEKSAARIGSVGVSLVGTGTPATIWDNLSGAQVLDGLLPRFTIIEFAGKKPYRNSNAHLYQADPNMLQWLSTFLVQSLQAQASGHKIAVLFADDAHTAHMEFERFCIDQENRLDEIGKAMWSRANAKTMKLAALAAIGVNPHAPVITLPQWNWAKAITVRETTVVLDKFERGDVGKNVDMGRRGPDHNAQQKAMAKVLMEYYTPSISFAGKSYRIGPGRLSGDDPHSFRSHGIIMASYLKQRLQNNNAFYGNSMKPSDLIEKTLLELCQFSVLREVNSRSPDMVRLFGEPQSNAARVYALDCSYDELRALC